MKKEIVPKIFLILIIVMSTYRCFLNRIGTAMIKEFKEFVENSKINKSLKEKYNKTISRKLIKSPPKISSSHGIFEMLFNMFYTDNNQNNYSKSIKKVNKNGFNQDSFISILMRIDLMLIYSISAILISIFCAFICLPVIFFFRKRSKFLNKNKIKEEEIVNFDQLNEILYNFESDQVCSICLDKVVEFNNKEEDILGHLNCRHNFHKLCIIEWIKRNKETCPFCRKIIYSIKYLNTIDIEKYVNNKCT